MSIFVDWYLLFLRNFHDRRTDQNSVTFGSILSINVTQLIESNNIFERETKTRNYLLLSSLYMKCLSI